MADAIGRAERIRKAVEAHCFHFGGTDLRVTISVGVAQLQSGEEIAALIQRSDARSTRRRRLERNRTYWHDGQTIRPAIEETAAGCAGAANTVRPQSARPCSGPRSESSD